MTLPDPNDCPHCGWHELAQRWGETICAMCHAPRNHVEPGCPARNAVAACEKDPFAPGSAVIRKDGAIEFFGGSVVVETARERRVYDGGPRVVE